MPCLRPIGGNKSADGVTLQESLSDARTASSEAGQYLEIPCGACDACRAKRVRSWAIRSHHESLSHTRVHEGVEIPNGCFITLTYDDDHLPPGNSLDVLHWQLFAKKLRNYLGSFRFLHCGEYGSNATKRPHYHACLYGIDFHEDRYEWTRTENSVQWRSPTLERAWSDSDGISRGFCTLAPLNFATSSYVAGYVFKKLKNDQQFENPNDAYYGANGTPIWQKKSEYITMSRRPGLGAAWIKKHLYDVYPRDQIRIGAKEYKPPAFYDRYLESVDPVLYDQVVESRSLHNDEKGPTFPQELKARSEIFTAQFSGRNHRKRNKIQ